VDVDAQTRLVVIGVRNDSPAVLRIVLATPRSMSRTFDDQGKTLQIEQVKRVSCREYSLEGKICGGRDCVLCVVYEAPILGARSDCGIGEPNGRG